TSPGPSSTARNSSSATETPATPDRIAAGPSGPSRGIIPMNLGCPDFQATARLSRRSLLRVGGAGIAGLTLPALLRASEEGRIRPAGGAGIPGPAPPALLRASAEGRIRPAPARNVIFLH